MTQEQALAACPLFAGLSPEDCAFALRCLKARLVHRQRGEPFNRAGEPLERFGLVVSGRVHVSMTEWDGHATLMASVGPGGTFGESLCYLGWPTAILALADAPTQVLLLDAACLKARPAAGEDPRVAALRSRFTAMLARRTLAMNDRIQILSRSGIRARLTVFFSQYARRCGPRFCVDFDRSSMAVYLGVDRCALSRELSRMQREGLLRFHKDQFELLAPPEEP